MSSYLLGIGTHGHRLSGVNKDITKDGEDGIDVAQLSQVEVSGDCKLNALVISIDILFQLKR